MYDHCERLPETGAKRPFRGADEARMDVGGTAAAKLPVASAAAPPRTAKSWLCVQDGRADCTGDVLATTVAALPVRSIGAILAT